MNRCLITAVVLCTALMSACDTGKNSPRGFSLPEGNAVSGKATFVKLQCNGCHGTPDVEQLAMAGENEISVQLSGKVSRVKTYADLVTSIINPAHRLAQGYPKDMVEFDNKSRMPNYNDVMSVEQLIDLVTYLQPHYTLKPYEPTRYRGYPG